MPLDGPSLRYSRTAGEGRPCERALTLAREIEELLTAAAAATDGFQVRLAQAMSRSLIDQLEEIGNPPMSASRLRTGEPS
jgi:hypothetical protein